MLLRLKLSDTSDVISIAAEFMVDVAEVEARRYVWRHQYSDRGSWLMFLGLKLSDT
jgi:hypothetical protein